MLPRLILDISLLARRRKVEKLLLSLELIEKLHPEKLYCSNKFKEKIEATYDWYHKTEPEFFPRLKQLLDSMQKKILPFS